MVVIDGMAMVCKVRNKGVTFDKFVNELLKYALTSSFHARCVDIVFNVCHETSIKNAEKSHCEVGRLYFNNIIAVLSLKKVMPSLISHTLIYKIMLCPRDMFS